METFHSLQHSHNFIHCCKNNNSQRSSLNYFLIINCSWSCPLLVLLFDKPYCTPVYWSFIFFCSQKKKSSLPCLENSSQNCPSLHPVRHFYASESQEPQCICISQVTPFLWIRVVFQALTLRPSKKHIIAYWCQVWHIDMTCVTK